MNNTTANNNVAVGFKAMINNTTGHSNTAFGYEALHNNNTGSYNSAFGSVALRHNTGAANVAVDMHLCLQIHLVLITQL